MYELSKIAEVKKQTGLCASSIYKMAVLGKFPKPIKLGNRSSRWIRAEVDQWIDDRITERNNQGISHE
tara:strand:+ start:1043 stop:1246 length:204 start_codon:yes stop_codon:yes gene_type:complete